ncbi:MAG TPA: DUF3999 domain-containing protein [Pseudoxanthomonas sp.]
MKRFAWIALLPLAAFAGIRDDYAQQWPLTLSRDDAGAYRVVLDREVYSRIHSAQLQDVEVVNAEGMTVPSALFAPEQLLAQAARKVDLPWFVLPGQPGGAAQDITLISERNADGSVRAITARVTDTGTQAGSASEFLIDASRLREPVAALELDWAVGEGALNAGYRVEGSDDLRNWNVLNDRGQLVDLARGGQRLKQNRIEVAGGSRYLRLVPLQQGVAPQITAVRAELASPPAAQAWQWEEIDGKRVVEKGGAASYHYRIAGRYPFERADVALPGNNTNEWILSSRDDEEAQWQHAAAPWMAFQVEGGNASNRSPPQSLQQVTRDRYWRLLPKTDVQGVLPKLRLGYRPEVVVFLAQGKGPYSLVAGSARAKRVDAPLPQLVDAMRAQRGQDWQPATAYLGKAQALAGEQALTPAPVERDWKAWLLWALLIGGALIVAWFAFSLLKKKP